MRRTREHPFALTAVAFVVAAGAVVAIAAAYGFVAFADAWSDLQWSVLAPAAWLSAVVLLAQGDRQAMPSLLWPWATAVPVGFTLGFSLATPARRDRIAA